MPFLILIRSLNNDGRHLVSLTRMHKPIVSARVQSTTKNKMDELKYTWNCGRYFNKNVPSINMNILQIDYI